MNANRRPADTIAEVERLTDLSIRLTDRLADDTLAPDARWLAQKDLETTDTRLAHARDQLDATCREGCP